MSNERAIELSKLMLWEDDDCKDAADELRRLVAENKSLRKDAERLKLIVESLQFDGYGWWLPDLCIKEGAAPPSGAEFCSVIDAAIDAAKESK